MNAMSTRASAPIVMTERMLRTIKCPYMNFIVTDLPGAYERAVQQPLSTSFQVEQQGSMRAHIKLSLFLVPLCLLAGCIQQGSLVVEPFQDERLSRPIVVATIEDGINPYHEAFRAHDGNDAERWAEVLGATPINLSREGAYQSRVKADAALWENLEPGKLYAFAGTRVLGISLSKPASAPFMLDQSGHGTAVSSVVMREAPEALLLVIQIDVRSCAYDEPQEYCPIVVPYAPAMEWAAEQPWIDIISLSVSYPGNPPMFLGPDEAPFVTASQRAHERGKIIVNAAGNYVVPGLVGPFTGPPWVITVGGVQPSQKGEQASASKGGDVVANYTDLVATHDSTAEWGWAGGTSLSTPLVAGTLASAIHEVRSASGMEVPLPSDTLRAALNATALLWSPAEWNPIGESLGSTMSNVTARTLPGVVPAQTGWGYVHGGMADEIARRVLENDLAPPPEKAQTAAYMAQWQSLRETYWSRGGI